MQQMKKLATIGLLSTAAVFSASAQVDLFYPATKTVAGLQAKSTVIQAMQTNDSVEHIETIGLNVSALQAGNRSLTLNFAADLQLATKQIDTYAIDQEAFAWVGAIDLGINKAAKPIDDPNAINPNQAVFMVHGERVFGQIIIDDLVYEIRTLETGSDYVLMKRDFSVLSHADDTPQDQFPIDWDSAKAVEPLRKPKPPPMWSM